MKKISLFKRSVAMVVLFVCITAPTFSQTFQLQVDTLLKVPAKLNNSILKDSLLVRFSSQGSQVEVRKFMSLVGGSFHPFSRIFRQNGLMVQYGRYISFAGSANPLGFVNCRMVPVVPPVSGLMISNESIFFAPLSFLALAIGGNVSYNVTAGRLEITTSPAPGFGSIFVPAGDIARALDNSGYIVQQGEINKMNPIEFCVARYTPNANGNNAAFPYLGIQVPPSPGRDSVYYIPVTFTMNEDEAVVITGKTPPECIYYSYRSYLMNRLYEFPPAATRTKINASLGDTKSLYRMRNDLPADSMFHRKFAVIMAADSMIAMHIKSTILAATPEIKAKDIHFDIIPYGIFRFGNNPKGDWLSYLHRVSIFKDKNAEKNYINNPPLEIMRVTPKQLSQRTFFRTPSFLSRTSGMNEFSLLPDLKLLEEGIFKAYNKSHEIIWLQPSPWVIEGYTAIQEGADALGEVHDVLYITTSDFLLRENDIALVYGVNHTFTGQSVYTNATIYGKKYWSGFGGNTNFEMEKSARRFMTDTVKADKFFAWSFARHPVPGNSFVYIVPSDTNKILQGINVNDTALIGTRLYINSRTKIGPDPLEVILDRTVLLRPVTTGVSKYNLNSHIPSMALFPNPVRENTTLEFTLPEWSDVMVALYNSSGQKVGNEIQIEHTRGTVQQQIKLSANLTSGIYYLHGIVSEKGNSEKHSLSAKLIFLGNTGE